MPIELNIHDDFSTILDGAEAISLKRHGSANTVAVTKAWRFSAENTEAQAGISGAVRNDVVWQFVWDEAADRPRVGDSLIDAANDCWTILAVVERGAKSRLQCVTRNLRIVHQLDDRIEIQQAIWKDLGSGPEITGWTTLRTAVPARIQPEQTTVDHTSDRPTSISTYRVLLNDNTPLDHNHRLVGPDGSVYQVQEYAQAERIDALPMATVKKLPSS
jgi:hypothetical protein